MGLAQGGATSGRQQWGVQTMLLLGSAVAVSVCHGGGDQPEQRMHKAAVLWYRSASSWPGPLPWRRNGCEAHLPMLVRRSLSGLWRCLLELVAQKGEHLLLQHGRHLLIAQRTDRAVRGLIRVQKSDAVPTRAQMVFQRLRRGRIQGSGDIIGQERRDLLTGPGIERLGRLRTARCRHRSPLLVKQRILSHPTAGLVLTGRRHADVPTTRAHGTSGAAYGYERA